MTRASLLGLVSVQSPGNTKPIRTQGEFRIDGQKPTYRVANMNEKLRNFAAILWILILLIPVVLLPFTTSVPAALWYGLVILGLGLLALMLSYPWPGKVAAGICLGVLVLAVGAVFFSSYFAATPAIKDARGGIVQNSTAALQRIRLGGTDQWITVRGRSKDNPLLLFLPGGLGGSELARTRIYLSGLEENFIVVNWEHPGSGKSYQALDAQELTVERYLNDAAELVGFLRQQTGQEKVYLMGESWGSYLGVRLAQARPDLFYAYVGSGQVINLTENDSIDYEFALRYARETGRPEIIKTLEKNGPPPYAGGGSFMKYAAYQNLLDDYLGPRVFGDGSRGSRLLDVGTAPEYGLVDKINVLRGLIQLFDVYYPKLNGHDLRTEAPKLDIPVYFIAGRLDVEASTALLEEYYQALDAPAKSLIWFENSGRTPMFDEPQRFIDVMVEQVLAETYPAR